MNRIPKLISLAVMMMLLLITSATAQGQAQQHAPPDDTFKGDRAQASTLSVSAVKDPSGRQAFQARVAVSPQGNGFQGQLLTIPAGKRLVIENVSAIARRPEGLQMEINFYSYLDNGDGVGDSGDITFHRIALTDQGAFGGTAISSANHRVLVFADEQIGPAHFGLVVQARLNESTTGFTQAQVTFSGYIEDLPVTR
jgi:hypothetical protein